MPTLITYHLLIIISRTQDNRFDLSDPIDPDVSRVAVDRVSLNC